MYNMASLLNIESMKFNIFSRENFVFPIFIFNNKLFADIPNP